MAKKSRQPNLPQETLERARRELSQQGIDVSIPATSAAETPAEAAAPRRKVQAVRAVDLRSEYTYVLTDLQNMAMLAAAMLLVLVALSFVI